MLYDSFVREPKKVLDMNDITIAESVQNLQHLTTDNCGFYLSWILKVDRQVTEHVLFH